MLEPEYKEALKLGQKEYKACVSKGEDGAVGVVKPFA